MVLKSQDGNEFELTFIKDSLPEMQDGAGDSAWATVAIRATTQDSSWEETAPCLSLFEFKTLADWLESVGAGGGSHNGVTEHEPSEIEVLEPGLGFAVTHAERGSVTIRVKLALEGRPEEFGVDAGAAEDEAESIDLRMHRRNVMAAAHALRAEMSELDLTTLKDDLRGERDGGIMGQPDDDLNLVDDERRRPPGAGRGKGEFEGVEGN